MWNVLVLFVVPFFQLSRAFNFISVAGIVIILCLKNKCVYYFLIRNSISVGKFSGDTDDWKTENYFRSMGFHFSPKKYHLELIIVYNHDEYVAKNVDVDINAIWKFLTFTFNQCLLTGKKCIYVEWNALYYLLDAAIYNMIGVAVNTLISTVHENSCIDLHSTHKALTYVKVSTRKSFVIFSDSMSVLQAIESQESKNPLVNRVLQACQKILSNGKFITFCWLPSHRDIRGNEDADHAAKDALSKAQPENFELPCTDVFMKIQPFISSLWQERWDKEVGNKLHAIMPQIDEKYYSGCTNRKDEVIINRLRIGHTRLTHSFRMENRPHPPLCDPCEGDHELTVKHI